MNKKMIKHAGLGYIKIPTFSEFRQAILNMPEVEEQDVKELQELGLINQSQMEELIGIVHANKVAKDFRTVPYNNFGYFNNHGPLTIKNDNTKGATMKTSLKRIAMEFLQMQDSDAKTVQLLDDAIEYQTKVQIQYGEGNYFTISPFAWHSSKEGNPTVKVYDEKGQVKSYSVDKIQNIKPLSNTPATKQKYNENIDHADESTMLQNKYDKNYDGDRNKHYDSFNDRNNLTSNRIVTRMRKMSGAKHPSVFSIADAAWDKVDKLLWQHFHELDARLEYGDGDDNQDVYMLYNEYVNKCEDLVEEYYTKLNGFVNDIIAQYDEAERKEAE